MVEMLAAETPKSVEELEQQLSNADLGSSEHDEAVQKLRQAGAPAADALERARQQLAHRRALTEHEWSEWLEDASEHPDASQESMIALFERAVTDVPVSALLWKAYTQYLSECGKPVEDQRSVFERALAHSGLHPRNAGVLFAAFRELEQASLDEAEEEAYSADEESIRLARSRLDKVYSRQLSVPLYGNDDVYQEYKEWREEQELGSIPDNILKLHEKCKAMLSQREQYEQSIQNHGEKSNEAILQSYHTYINFEMKHADPARIRLIYERALLQFPGKVSLWEDYLIYMDSRLKVRDHTEEVVNRAVRFCPKSGSLWCFAIRSAELASKVDHLYQRFNTALQAGMNNAEEYLDVFLSFMDFARRQWVSGKDKHDRSDGGSFREDFRAAARQCVDYLDQAFPSFRDTSLKLPAYWARTEANTFDDVSSARQTWEEFVKKKGYAGIVEVWMGYISFERELGNIPGARAIFKRCFSRRLAFANNEEAGEYMCNMWLRFERENGSASDFKDAFDKISPKVTELKRRREHKSKSEKDKHKHCHQEEKKKDHSTMNGNSREHSSQQKPQNKRNISEVEKAYENHEEPVFKQQRGSNDREMEDDPKDAYMNTTDDDADPAVTTIFAYSLDFHTTTEEVQNHFGRCGKIISIRMPPDTMDEQKNRGIVYIQYSCRPEAEAALQYDGSNLREKTIRVTWSKKTTSGEVLTEDAQSTEPEATIFVKHLRPSVKQRDLLKLFSPCGHIKSLRMPVKRDDPSQHRGFAYIQFNNDEEVKSATSLNGTRLRGKEIFVARSLSSAQPTQRQEGEEATLESHPKHKEKSSKQTSNGEDAGASSSKQFSGKRETRGEANPDGRGDETAGAASSSIGKSMTNEDFRNAFLR